ncbi:hypothetical protein ACA758_00625 [Mycoplasmopsis agassizii]|uniref:Uncharacterized protein n=1 Tax=Mycoplasmopsis agassizii TaxID=33922 RepID=A0ABX4H4C8_9BACT|nr:hypothetical protein [Mycoplasmopsis agassizii]PAF54745.1 hypothetical protein CJF60_03335 [Mycoplasmopsis agassizii]SMC15881.1 hypothetical protein SAMN02745179_00135 [Mycoplasmopsis agassizii]
MRARTKLFITLAVIVVASASLVASSVAISDHFDKEITASQNQDAIIKSSQSDASFSQEDDILALINKALRSKNLQKILVNKNSLIDEQWVTFLNQQYLVSHDSLATIVDDNSETLIINLHHKLKDQDTIENIRIAIDKTTFKAKKVA